MRKIILEYFGFKLVKQNNCCTICDKDSESTENVLSSTNKKVRELPTENRIHLKSCTQETSQCFSMIDVPVVDINDMVENIMDGIEYISSESDLLNKHGIWDEACSSQIFSVVCELTILKRTFDHTGTKF